jgi:nicotinamidase-related amidase
MQATASHLPQVAATPYAWPFDGWWSVADTALVVVDMQADYCSSGGYLDQIGLDIAPLAAVVAPIRAVLDRLRPLGFSIIHTSEGHRPDLSDLNDTKRRRSARLGAEIGTAGPLGRFMIRGEPGSAIVPELEPLPGEPVVDKPGRNAFYATDLDQLLRRQGIRNLIFAGVTTDVGVHATMRDANDRGFECLLLENCCAATATAHHDAILRYTVMGHGLFGTVAPSAALFDALGG